MAISKLTRQNTLHKQLSANDVFSFPIKYETILIVCNQPYGGTAAAGLYVVTGGYTNSDAGITAIKASDRITVKKEDNGTTCKITASDSAFILIIRE